MAFFRICFGDMQRISTSVWWSPFVKELASLMVALTKIPAYTFGMIPACRQIRISSGFELWHGVSVISDSRHSYETPTVSAPLQDTTLGTMPAAKASLVSAGSSYPLSATDQVCLYRIPLWLSKILGQKTVIRRVTCHLEVGDQMAFCINCGLDVVTYAKNCFIRRAPGGSQGQLGFSVLSICHDKSHTVACALCSCQTYVSVPLGRDGTRLILVWLFQLVLHKVMIFVTFLSN